MIKAMGAGAFLARTLLLGATGACAVLNGWSASPFCALLASEDAAGACRWLDGWGASSIFDSVDYMLGVALGGYPLLTRSVINTYITPMALSVMTLVLAGIPAALYERIRGLKASSPVSLIIWLAAAAVLLVLPALLKLYYGGDDFS